MTLASAFVEASKANSPPYSKLHNPLHQEKITRETSSLIVQVNVHQEEIASLPLT